MFTGPGPEKNWSQAFFFTCTKEKYEMNIYIDTCVLPRAQLQEGRIYRDKFGKDLGFELLMMFDLQEFEENLKQNLDLFAEGPLFFHEPVWGVEHSEPKGSKAWEEGMYHLRLTKKYADILHPEAMVYHLNNGVILPEEKERRIRTALANYEDMREMFPDVPLLVENTGTKADGSMLLNQAEFTDLCRARKLPVLIDVGHATANGWDILKLIRDLHGQIGGFHLHNNDGLHDLHNRLTDGVLDIPELVSCMDLLTPDAPRIIEYSRPAYHGEPLIRDIETLRGISGIQISKKTEKEQQESGTAELSSDQIAYVLNNMKEAVCLTGMDGTVIYANRAAEKLFGIHAEDHKRIWDAIPFREENDPLIQLFIDGVAEKKGSLRSMVDYVNNVGDLFHLYVNLTCEADDSGLILIVINDLTHLINAQSAFARYTSPEIANYVLTAPEGKKQGGQEREVSILMSDLRGFTAMSTHLASTDLITLLNHYFESMSAVIRRFEGTVIEFLGDGIFVVFGAPSDLPNHAAFAVGCAIEMQNAMSEVNAWNRERGYPELAMGIGINSGKCVVGNIGSGNKMKYGCMGETVNLAGRLEGFCIGGQVLISENTRKLIPMPLSIIGENSFMPKGGREEMKFYNITGIGSKHIQKAAEEAIEWESLPAVKESVFFLLDGKTVGREKHAGQISRISTDGKFGLLETETALKPLQDLMIRAGDREVYAKVMEPEEKGYRIGFTQGSLI